jgi:hypothetical protein
MTRLFLILLLCCSANAATLVATNFNAQTVRIGPAAGGGNIVVSVAANNDDGQMLSSAWYNNGESSDGITWAGYVSSEEQYFVFNFVLSAAIPAGTTVTNATVRVYGRDAYLWSNGTDDLVVKATDAASAPVVANVSERPVECDGGSTATTTTTVAWNNVTWDTAGWNTSPNISTVINELVSDNSGLANGARICLWINGGPVEHYVGGELYEHAGSNPAELTIQW